MALIYCKECGNQISQQARSCPKCGSPQKKSNSWILIVVIILILGGGAVFYFEQYDDRNEKIAAATEILNNNKDDIIDLSTKQVKREGLKFAINILADLSSKCIIDSLAVRLADKFSLNELNDLKTKPASNIIEVTKLVTENIDVCEKCLSFQN